MARILVVNTGSTSTKIALFDGHDMRYEKNIEHSTDQSRRFPDLASQYAYRLEAVFDALDEASFDLTTVKAVAARGGTFGYADGGAYIIEENLINACKNPVTQHPSNLAAPIAWKIAKKAGCNAYVYDAVCVNEVTETARITGIKGVLRRPFSHVLNTRAAAREAAAEFGREYEEMNIIVAHLGGGISVNIHSKGRIVDLISDDEGAMSPERAGRLNGKALIEMCFEGKRDKAQLQKLFRGEGGLVSHLGTNDMRLVEKRVDDGDDQAMRVITAMAYQLSKDIASLAAVVFGEVNIIVITGGAARYKLLTDLITERVSFIAPVRVYPGAMEMRALAEGVLRVLNGTEEAKIYSE